MRADGYTVRMTLVGSDRALLVTACILVGLGAGRLACGLACAWKGSQLSRGLRHGSAVALAAALGSLAARYGLTPELFELGALACVLLFLSLTDLEMRVIPNGCILCMLGIRALALCLGCIRGTLGLVQVGYYVASALLVGAALLLTVLAADRILGEESMGGGDLKLFAALALYVGWQQSMLLVSLSCLLGLAVGPLVGDRGRGDGRGGSFPFGPSISAACLVTLLVGDAVVGWYVGLLG